MVLLVPTDKISHSPLFVFEGGAYAKMEQAVVLVNLLQGKMAVISEAEASVKSIRESAMNEYTSRPKSSRRSRSSTWSRLVTSPNRRDASPHSATHHQRPDLRGG